MHLHRHSMGDCGVEEVAVDTGKGVKAPSLSVAVVLCKATADVSLSDASSENAGSSSESSSCSLEWCTQDADKVGWDALPAPALAVVGQQLPLKTLAAARAACKAWSIHLSEALTQTAPLVFLSGPSQSAGVLCSVHLPVWRATTVYLHALICICFCQTENRPLSDRKACVMLLCC